MRRMFAMKGSRSVAGRGFVSWLLAVSAVSPARAAVFHSDGGITLWISYDQTGEDGASLQKTLSDSIEETNVLCGPTEEGKKAWSVAVESKASCPTSGTCTGQQKLEGDLRQLARYIYESTDGKHYLRTVYVADRGRSWQSADIQWNMRPNGSAFAARGGWAHAQAQLLLNNAVRTCAHEVLHHEIGHYIYGLFHRYPNGAIKPLDLGCMASGAEKGVEILEPGDRNTVMGRNYPHRFTDHTNAEITVKIDGSPSLELILTGDSASPTRKKSGCQEPFGQDDWTGMIEEHADLEYAHTPGDFSFSCASAGAGTPPCPPSFEVHVVPSDVPFPGAVILLDRSGSMSEVINGRPASEYVQEAGFYLYHSTAPGRFAGSYLFNQDVHEQFPYGLHPTNGPPPIPDFVDAQGATDIAKALETALDDLEAKHQDAGPSGAAIYLMSDGKQTVGDDLWDQVQRANELGIAINAWAFGNADAEVMQEIADSASGSAHFLSEATDAAELKIDLSREVTVGRGYTPIYRYKGPLVKTGTDGRGELYEGSFNLPQGSRQLLVYVMLARTDASRLVLRLQNESGEVVKVAGDDFQKQGRFLGVRIPDVGPGPWRLELRPGGGSSPRAPGVFPIDDVEIVAYTDAPELDAQAWLEPSADPDEPTLKARLRYRYPLAEITVRARIYDGASALTKVELLAGKHGASNYDGVYAAALDLAYLRQRMPGKATMRIDVEFIASTASLPAPRVPYEPGATYASIVRDYQPLSTVAFTAYATILTPLRPRAPKKPSIGTVSCSKRLSPDERMFKAVVKNARPLADQTRVSLGPDIVGRVTDVTTIRRGAPARASRVTIQYTERQRGRSRRDLVLQFGKSLVRKPSAVRLCPP